MDAPEQPNGPPEPIATTQPIATPPPPPPGSPVPPPPGLPAPPPASGSAWWHQGWVPAVGALVLAGLLVLSGFGIGYTVGKDSGRDNYRDLRPIELQYRLDSLPPGLKDRLPNDKLRPWLRKFSPTPAPSATPSPTRSG